MKGELFEDGGLLSQLDELPMDFDLDGIQNSTFLDPQTLSPNDSAYQSDSPYTSSPQISPTYLTPCLQQQQPSPPYQIVNQQVLPQPQVKSIPPSIPSPQPPHTVLISSAAIPQTTSHVVYSTLPIQTSQHIIVQQQQVPSKKKQSSKQTTKAPIMVQNIGHLSADQVAPVVLQVR